MEDCNDTCAKFSHLTTPTAPEISSVEPIMTQKLPESVTTLSSSTTTTTTMPSTDTTTSELVIIKKREKFSKDSNGERIRDEKGYRLRAAGLCTRLNKSCNIELLLVSGRCNSNSWVIPGGGIEEDENAQQAAIREVYEEAGIRATIRSMIGEFKVPFFKC
uniref:Nudix hydrolase domain-containing protein n=1 Tax=Panagrolaimus superbus TaxID=310955 RepID=A0A914YS87_9BILA